MKATYDDKAKALYVYINDNHVEYTETTDDGVMIDYTGGGVVVGYEFLLDRPLEFYIEHLKPRKPQIKLPPVDELI